MPHSDIKPSERPIHKKTIISATVEDKGIKGNYYQVLSNQEDVGTLVTHTAMNLASQRKDSSASEWLQTPYLQWYNLRICLFSNNGTICSE